MLILDLCGGTGEWSRPYREAGYCVELVDKLNGRDARLLQRMRGVWGVLAAPVCTDFSYARNRYEPTEAEYLEALSLVDACIRIAWVHRQNGAKWWALENPRNKAAALSRPGPAGVLPVGIRRRGPQADVCMGRLHATDEDAETADEAEHLSHAIRERAAGGCDHTAPFRAGIL